jgi:hypothetical protein
MSVVLRCRICGTTQGHVGECEACSEGKVRYFCTNHQEGIWLDSPVCSGCGARFGDPARPSPGPRTPAGPTRPSGAPDFRAPGRRRPPEHPPEPDFGRPLPERPAVDEPPEPDLAPRAPTLGELLGEIIRERARARGRYEAEEVPWTAPGHRSVFPLAGCLARMVGVVFLLIATVIFLILLFGGFIIN